MFVMLETNWLSESQNISAFKYVAATFHIVIQKYLMLWEICHDRASVKQLGYKI